MNVSEPVINKGRTGARGEPIRGNPDRQSAGCDGGARLMLRRRPDRVRRGINVLTQCRLTDQDELS
jgi:hypothetical protein